MVALTAALARCARYRRSVTSGGDAIDLGAFKHVVVPLGVFIGLGVARIVTAGSHYLRRRARVRFSITHGIWCLILFLWFIGLWWIAWGLRHVEADLWSYFTLIFLLVGPCFLYFGTMLLLPDIPEDGTLDLGECFEIVGRPFFLSMAGMLIWLVVSELWLLREPWVVLPKRIFQSIVLALFTTGAILPTRRTAGLLGVVTLPIVIVVLATVRAKLT